MASRLSTLAFIAAVAATGYFAAENLDLILPDNTAPDTELSVEGNHQVGSLPAPTPGQ